MVTLGLIQFFKDRVAYRKFTLVMPYMLFGQLEDNREKSIEIVPGNFVTTWNLVSGFEPSSNFLKDKKIFC